MKTVRALVELRLVDGPASPRAARPTAARELRRTGRLARAHRGFASWDLDSDLAFRFRAVGAFVLPWRASDAGDFRGELASLGLPEREKLTTIDAFPLMSLALASVIPGAAHAAETVENIIERIESARDD